MARVTLPPAGRWARLTAEAISVYLKRSDMSARDLYEAAGMSRFYWNTRMADGPSFTLNDIEAVCGPLKVTPLEIAVMAAKLGEVDSSNEAAEGHSHA